MRYNFFKLIFSSILLFLSFGFFVKSSYATSCSPPVSGNYTINTSCTFANTEDGVDGGAGAANTAAIILTGGISSNWAWGERIGWISLNCSNTSSCATVDYGVTNTSNTYSGYAWGERTGWISFNCSNTSSCGTVSYSVTETNGVLSGWAWGERIGWISLNCSNTSSCGTVNYSVTDTNGTLSGYAWGERTGWISFNCSNTSSCATVSYGGTLTTGSTLTVGTVANQKIAFGSITINRGSSIIINKGVGASLVKGHVWVQDCNADGIPGSLTQTVATSAPSTSYKPRATMSTMSSTDANDQIDATNSYAWGENIGWINFRSSTSVDIPTTGDLTGWLWGENIGWISLNCINTSTCGTVNYKVTNTAGTLSGYAYAENVGWISFNCSNTSSCGTVNYSTTIDGSGNFAGYAYGENIGWISFNCSNTSSCATVSYFVKKAC